MHDKYHNLPTTDDDRAELALFELLKIMLRIPTIATTYSDPSRPPVTIDRDQR